MDVTEQKLQEQLLNRIAELDYDIITEIDILQRHPPDASRSTAAAGIDPGQGEFQKEIRKVADRFMDEAARREYLEKLDYRLHARSSWSSRTPTPSWWR